MAKTMSIPYNGMDFQACLFHVRNAICRCNWRIQSDTPNGIYASVGISMLSWGENIEIHFFPGYFTIQSACTVPIQIIDWGKNSANINKFLRFYNASCAGY